MTTCDFEVSIEIHDGVTATILGDLNDRANGLTVGVPLVDDADQLRRITTDSPFVSGDFEVIATPTAGRLDVVLVTRGLTYAFMMSNYRAARGWWRQPGSFYLDVTIEGDGLRYLARQPDVTSSRLEPSNLVSVSRSWLLSFPVQPNPVVL